MYFFYLRLVIWYLFIFKIVIRILRIFWKGKKRGIIVILIVGCKVNNLFNWLVVLYI